MPTRAGPARRHDGDLTDVLIEVATLFYIHGLSQVQIADSRGIDPSTVSRYLKRARDGGLIRIDIRRPALPQADLGRAVADQYGLSRVVAVPTTLDDAIGAVAAAAAEQIDGLLRTGMRFGASWGRTIAAVVSRLRPGTVSRLEVAQLAGGLSESAPGTQGYDLVLALSELYPDSRTRYLHAPAIVDNIAIRDALLTDTSIRAALEAAAQSELAVVGIGDMGMGSTLVAGHHITGHDRMRLLAAGAVGNMNTRFFDAAGHPVGDLDNRTIAVTWDQLSRIPTVLAVAAGEEKAAAVAGALRTGCVDILVVDAGIAERLLE